MHISHSMSVVAKFKILGGRLQFFRIFVNCC